MTFSIIKPSPPQPFSYIYEGICFGRSYLKHQSAETPKRPQRGKSWGLWAHTRRWPYDPRSSPCQRSCLGNASGNAAYPMGFEKSGSSQFRYEHISVTFCGKHHGLGKDDVLNHKGMRRALRRHRPGCRTRLLLLKEEFTDKRRPSLSIYIILYLSSSIVKSIL